MQLQKALELLIGTARFCLRGRSILLAKHLASSEQSLSSENADFQIVFCEVASPRANQRRTFQSASPQPD
jgi:hypothetical protein